jgi:hypothetical protein
MLSSNINSQCYARQATLESWVADRVAQVTPRPRRRRRPPARRHARPPCAGLDGRVRTAPIKLVDYNPVRFTIRFDHNKVRGFATPRCVASPQAKVRGFATSQGARLRHKPRCAASPQAKVRGFATSQGAWLRHNTCEAATARSVRARCAAYRSRRASGGAVHAVESGLQDHGGCNLVDHSCATAAGGRGLDQHTFRRRSGETLIPK